MSLDARLQRLWYGPAWRGLMLWPLALLYRLAIVLRSAAYSAGWLSRTNVGVPVIVVGNLTVGGTGKTPVAAWLAEQLSRRGRRVGVVLRGYGGAHVGAPRVVGAEDDCLQTGDEAIVHARRRPHVVVIGADRVAAARLAVRQGADVIVCDDGLQHLRLSRDFEVIVVDAVRGFGNGWTLPAGPLREPVGRMETVDAVVCVTRNVQNGFAGAAVQLCHPRLISVSFAIGDAVNVRTGERRPISTFSHGIIHSVAGIGHPDAFFAALRAQGLEPICHRLPDHGRLDPADLPFPPGSTVLMTEKDAVKCSSFATSGWWWVDLEVRVVPDQAQALLMAIMQRISGSPSYANGPGG